MSKFTQRAQYLQGCLRLKLIALGDLSNTTGTGNACKLFSIKNDFTRVFIVDLRSDAQVVCDLCFTTAEFTIDFSQRFGFNAATEKVVKGSRASRDTYCSKVKGK